jgi:prolyl-tRNA synthetase
MLLLSRHCVSELTTFLYAQMGSKEENAASMAHYFADHIGEMPHFCNDVLLDDRPSLTIGKKLMEAKKTGYPYIIVVGKKSLDFLPKFELHDLTKNLKLELSGLEIFQYLRTHSQRT